MIEPASADALPAEVQAGDSAGLAPSPIHRYPIDFTGSGSEYFRIWIVNLLLTLVTAGIYSAWAKVRKLQYFYRNTRLDGATAFDFHGDPKRILLGRVIAVALFFGYNAAFRFTPAAGLAAVVVAIAIAPWLVRRAIQFRHSNSSYRGLRFGFAGSNRAAYLALGPAVVLLTAPAAISVLAPQATPHGAGLVLLPTLALFLLYPLLHYRFKRFHHGNARYASLAGTFAARWGNFYRVYLPLVLLIIGLVFVMGLGFAVVMPLIGKTGREPGAFQIFVIVAFSIFAYGLLLATAAPFLVTRLQNMIWGKTRLGDIAFESRLRMWPIMRLYLKNAALVALTLGLYWPWAAVAVARHRLRAVTVLSPGPLSDLVGQLEAPRVAATGDAAADVFGFDIGL